MNWRTGGFNGIEKKFLDTELASTQLTTSWAAFNPTGTGCTDSLSVPAEGNGESQRIGRAFTIDSIYIRGVLSSTLKESQAAPVQDFRSRVIVYIDTQTNSAEATATEIMDAGGASDILAFRNLQNTHRFKVLFDKTVTFSTSSGQQNEGAANLFAVGAMERRFSFFHRFTRGIKVQCDGTAADVASCTNTNIGVAAISSSTSLTPLITYQARLRYRG